MLRASLLSDVRASLNRTMDSLSPGGNPPNLGGCGKCKCKQSSPWSVGGEKPKPLGSGVGFLHIRRATVGGCGGSLVGIYLWESVAAANAFYTPDWVAMDHALGGATAASGMGNADGRGKRRTAACCRRIASAGDLRSPSPRKGWRPFVGRQRAGLCVFGPETWPIDNAQDVFQMLSGHPSLLPLDFFDQPCAA